MSEHLQLSLHSCILLKESKSSLLYWFLSVCFPFPSYNTNVLQSTIIVHRWFEKTVTAHSHRLLPMSTPAQRGHRNPCRMQRCSRQTCAGSQITTHIPICTSWRVRCTYQNAVCLCSDLCIGPTLMYIWGCVFKICAAGGLLFQQATCTGIYRTPVQPMQISMPLHTGVGIGISMSVSINP